MKPITPVIPGANLVETVIADNQPPYLPLPSHVTEDGYVLSRWRLSWKERLHIFLFGDLYHWQGAFGHSLQPVAMTIEKPQTS